MAHPSSSLQTLPRRLWGGGAWKGADNNVIGPVIRERGGGGRETEGSFFTSVVSCVWKLVDVSEVGVVED